MLRVIISGGQTGVDRAALDAALQFNFKCSGYCPNGRIAEDGKIDSRYPLIEHTSKNFSQRTQKNVLEADGTIIFYNRVLTGGTALTVKLCKAHLKHSLLIDASLTNVSDACDLVSEFIIKNKINILNVAGPRLSQWKDGYQFTYMCIELVIKQVQ